MATVCAIHEVEYNKWGQCPGCHRVSKKRYKSSEKGKSSILKYQASENGKLVKRKWKQTTKERLKDAARNEVCYAIRKGNLIRQPCQICGNPKTEAHHAWGYAEEHRLHVIFLCGVHHRLADKDSSFNEQVKSKSL